MSSKNTHIYEIYSFPVPSSDKASSQWWPQPRDRPDSLLITNQAARSPFIRQYLFVSSQQSASVNIFCDNLGLEIPACLACLLMF